MRVLRSVRQLSNAKRTTLPNGATVITQAGNSGVACVGLVSGLGARSETQSGQATVNRSITLENLGSMAGVNVSSYLHRERSGVFGTAIPSAAGAFAKNLVNAANAREVTGSARGHALAQLEAASASEYLVTEDYLHMGAYQDTPLANSPLGTTAGITEGNAAEIINWRAAANGGANVVLVGTGNVNHDELCEAAGGLAEEGGFFALPESCQFTGCTFADRNDHLEDAWIRVGFQVPGLLKPRENAVFQVLKHVFGNYTPGDQHPQHSVQPLIKSFTSTRPIRRTEWGGTTLPVTNNYVLKIESSLFSYSDTALFGYYAHVPKAYEHVKGIIDRPVKGDHVHYKLFRELKRMWAGLNEHEIAAAKNAAILEYHQNSSNPLKQADRLGAEGLVSNAANAFNTAALLGAVDKKSIEEAVHKYMFDQEFVETWYGAADCMTDALATRERSWNFLPSGKGQEMFFDRTAY